MDKIGSRPVPARVGTRLRTHSRTSSRTHRAAILTALALLLSLTLAGCGSGGGDSEVDLQGAQTAGNGNNGDSGTNGDSGANGDSGTNGDGIDPDQGGGDKVSISVASLPFGGAASENSASQCITAGFNGGVDVPEGAVLSISVSLSSDLFALDGSACDGFDGPWCDGLQITGTVGPCNVGAVLTREPTADDGPASAIMTGTLDCEAPVADQCEQVRAALESSPTTLAFTPPPVAESESTE